MPRWYDQANCVNTDPEAFFYNETTTPEDILAAKRVCNRCKVAEYCLRYALQENIDHGIWGGLTATERNKLRRGQYERKDK